MQQKKMMSSCVALILVKVSGMLLLIDVFMLSGAKLKGGLGIIFGNFFFHAKVMSIYSTSIMEMLVPIWNVDVP